MEDHFFWGADAPLVCRIYDMMPSASLENLPIRYRQATAAELGVQEEFSHGVRQEVR